MIEDRDARTVALAVGEMLGLAEEETDTAAALALGRTALAAVGWERVLDHLAAYQEALMREASEDHWCAGWMDGLEAMMWDGPMRDKREAIRCRELAAITGVWIVWDERAGGPIRLALADWRDRHDPSLGGPIERLAEARP